MSPAMRRLKSGAEGLVFWTRVGYVAARYGVHLILGVVQFVMLWVLSIAMARCMIHQPHAYIMDRLANLGAILMVSFAGQAWSARHYLGLFKERFRPGPFSGPSFLRNGLFGGRYAGLFPWTRTEAKAARVLEVVCVSSWSLIGMAYAWTRIGRTPAPWPAEALALDLIATQYVATALLVMKIWHVLHLRLRPYQEPRGFDPLPPVQRQARPPATPHA